MTRLHESVLEGIVKDLTLIGIDREDVSLIIKEPVIRYPDSTALRKSSDLIIGMKTPYHLNGRHYAIPVELKGNPDKKEYATLQLSSTMDFIQEKLNLYVPYGLFVVYNHNDDMIRVSCEKILLPHRD